MSDQDLKKLANEIVETWNSHKTAKEFYDFPQIDFRMVSPWEHSDLYVLEWADNKKIRLNIPHRIVSDDYLSEFKVSIQKHIRLKIGEDKTGDPLIYKGKKPLQKIHWDGRKLELWEEIVLAADKIEQWNDLLFKFWINRLNKTLRMPSSSDPNAPKPTIRSAREEFDGLLRLRDRAVRDEQELLSKHMEGDRHEAFKAQGAVTVVGQQGSQMKRQQKSVEDRDNIRSLFDDISKNENQNVLNREGWYSLIIEKTDFSKDKIRNALINYAPFNKKF